MVSNSWADKYKWVRMCMDYGILAAILLTFALSQCEAQLNLQTSACYGNMNNYLRMECPDGESINVTKIKHAAKVKTANCSSPASVETYRPECCIPESSDCTITVDDSVKVKCNGKSICVADATWSNVISYCDATKFPSQSNYMVVDYICIVPERVTKNTVYAEFVDRAFLGPTPATTVNNFNSTSSISSTVLDKVRLSTYASSTTSTTSSSVASVTVTPTTTTKATSKPALTTAYISGTTTTTATTNDGSVGVNVTIQETTNTNSTFSNTTATADKNTTSTLKGNTQKHTSNKSSSPDELSDAMVGAIVGGSLGMMFTLVLFIFYWGRKRHLRIVGKPQATVWDYLLSQTFTVRGTRGYDHFHSIRSSASTDSETSSPMARKNLWLPNIVHRDNNPPEDAVSNYDNDANGTHRVELHPHADPSPYAFLNLYIGPSNLNHHEA